MTQIITIILKKISLLSGIAKQQSYNVTKLTYEILSIIKTHQISPCN